MAEEGHPILPMPLALHCSAATPPSRCPRHPGTLWWSSWAPSRPMAQTCTGGGDGGGGRMGRVERGTQEGAAAHAHLLLARSRAGDPCCMSTHRDRHHPPTAPQLRAGRGRHGDRPASGPPPGALGHQHDAGGWGWRVGVARKTTPLTAKQAAVEGGGQGSASLPTVLHIPLHSCGRAQPLPPPSPPTLIALTRSWRRRRRAWRSWRLSRT